MVRQNNPPTDGLEQAQLHLFSYRGAVLPQLCAPRTAEWRAVAGHYAKNDEFVCSLQGETVPLRN
jgi:hypothetical protein